MNKFDSRPIDANRRLQYRSTMFWNVVDHKLKSIVGSSVKLSMIGRTNAVDYNLSPKSTQLVYLSVTSKQGKRCKIAGTVDDINRALSHQYANVGNELYTEGYINALITTITRNYTSVVQLSNHLQMMTIGNSNVRVNQLLTFNDLTMLIKQGNSIVNMLKIVRQHYHRDDKLANRLGLKDDIVLFSDRYRNDHTRSYNDVKIITSSRYSDKQTIRTAIVNSRLNDRDIIPINITNKLSMIDRLNNRVITAVGHTKPLEIIDWNWNDTLTSVSIKFNRSITLDIDSTAVKFRVDGKSKTVAKSQLFPSLFQCSHDDQLTTWSSDTQRVKTFLNGLNDGLKMINNQVKTPDDFESVYKELSEEDQTTFVTVANLIESIVNTAKVDSWEFLIYYHFYRLNQRYRYNIVTV